MIKHQNDIAQRARILEATRSFFGEEISKHLEIKIEVDPGNIGYRAFIYFREKQEPQVVFPIKDIHDREEVKGMFQEGVKKIIEGIMQQ